MSFRYYVSSGESIDGFIISSGDYLRVSSGGLATHVVVCSIGTLYVDGGGTATQIDWTPGTGEVRLGNGAFVSFDSKISGVFFASSNTLLSQMQETTSQVLNEYDHSMFVMSGGTATRTTVSGGSLFVFNGGTANRPSIKQGYAFVYNGGEMNSAIASGGGGILYVFSGGIANYTQLQGRVYVEGGTVNSTVQKGGSLYIISNGLANGTIVSDGEISVDRGGRLLDTTVSGGRITIYSAGTATNLNIVSSAYLSFIVAPNTVVQATSNGQSIETSDGIISGQTITFGGYLLVESGGVANGNTVKSCSITIRGDAVANSNTIEESGYIEVNKKGFINSTTINSGGRMLAIYGGSMENVIVKSGGSLDIFTNGTGTANNIMVESGGRFYTFGESIITNIHMNEGVSCFIGAEPDTNIRGTFGEYDFEIVDGGASGIFVEANCSFTVGRDCEWKDISINSGGNLGVYGSLDSATVNSGGIMLIDNSGSATNIRENGGWVEVYSSASASFAANVIDGLQLYENQSASVHSGTVANDVFVHSGLLTLFSGGVANHVEIRDNNSLICVCTSGEINHTVINNGTLNISGTANDIVQNQGAIQVWSGGTANDVMLSGGIITVYKDGTANNVEVKTGASVEVNDGKLQHAVVNEGNLRIRGEADGIILEGGRVSLSANGRMKSILVNNNAEVNIFDYGVADTVVLLSGTLHVYDSGSALNILAPGKDVEVKVENGATATYLPQKGVYYFGPDGELVSASEMSSMTLGPACRMFMFADGSVENITVNEAGLLQMFEGGSANNVRINADASFAVVSGAAATNIQENGGWVEVEEGATATFRGNTFSGLTLGPGQSATVHAGTVASQTVVNSGGLLQMFEGGSANNVKVNADASFTVVDGAAATNIRENGGWVEVEEGATAMFTDNTISGLTLGPEQSATLHAGTIASQTVVSSGGLLQMFDGGAANGVTIHTDASFRIGSGAAATGILENGGWVEVEEGATATFTDNTISGLTLGSGRSATVHMGTVAREAIVSSGGVLRMFEGGAADQTTVSGGEFTIRNGAADQTTVSGGKLTVDGGTANQTVLVAGRKNNWWGEELTHAEFDLISGGSAGNTEIQNYGMFTVNTGAVATDTVVYTGGSFRIAEGALAYDTVIHDGGAFRIDDGAIANDITIHGSGYLHVSSGGTATDIEWIPFTGGTIEVDDGAVVTFSDRITGVFYGSGNELFSSALTLTGLTVEPEQKLLVTRDGTANETTVRFGQIHVSKGGAVNMTTLSTVGELHVSSGGVANDLTIREEGQAYISEGGVLNDVLVDSTGMLFVSYGATVSNTMINTRGRASVSSGGTMAHTTLNSHATLHVDSGGLASDVTINYFGSAIVHDGGRMEDVLCTGGYGYQTVEVQQGGVISSARIMDGVNIFVSGSAYDITLSNGTGNTNWSEMILYSGGYAENVTIYNGGSLYGSGGTAKNVILNSGGRINADTLTIQNLVLNEGISYYAGDYTMPTKNITVNAGAKLQLGSYVEGIVENGGGVFGNNGVDVKVRSNSFSGLALKDGQSATIHSGTTATDVTVEAGATLYIYSGGIANEVVENGGYVNILGDATVTFVSNTFSGLTLSGKGATVHSRTIAIGTEITSFGYLSVEGGEAIRTHVSGEAFGTWYGIGYHAGSIYVADGGIAKETMLENGGKMIVYSAIATGTTVNSGGSLCVEDGGRASTTTLNEYGSIVLAGTASATNTVVNGSGEIHVSSGATLDQTTMNGGNILASDGASVKKTVVNADAAIRAEAGAYLSGTTVYAGGRMEIAAGASAYGIVEDGGWVEVENGAKASFISHTISGLVLNGNQSATAHARTTIEDAEINSSATLSVVGGVVNCAVINGDYNGWGDHWGTISVSNGGTVNSVTINTYGHLHIENMGAANDTTLNYCATMEVRSGGSAENANVGSYGTIYVLSGGTLTGAAALEYGAVIVSGGTACDILVSGSAASLYLRDGLLDGATISSRGNGMFQSGLARNVVVDAGGSVGIWGAIAEQTVVKSGGDLGLYDQSATRTTVSSGGTMHITNGAYADDTIVDGRLTLSYAASANNTLVNKGGRLWVSSSARATNILENGGWVEIEDGAEVTFGSNSFSGLILDSNQSAMIHSGTTATGTTVNSNARLNIYSKGKADGIVVSRGGTLMIDRGTAVTGVKILNSARLEMTLDSRTNISGTIGGSAFAVENGAVSGFEVGASRSLQLRDGGTAEGATATEDGKVNILSGGVANDTTVNGCWDFTVEEGGVANSTTVNSGTIRVKGGGFANGAVINGGQIEIMEHGSAADMTVRNAGNLRLSTGVSVTGLTIEGGAYVDMTVDNRTQVAGTIDGVEFEMKEGLLDRFSMSRGTLTVASGGMATNLAIENTASLNVTGGTVKNLTAGEKSSWRGGIKVSNGILTGQIGVSNASIFFYEDGALLFNVSELTPDVDTTRLSNYNSIRNSPILLATVSDAQIQGRYILSRNAIYFNEYISFATEDGTNLEELTKGQQFELAGKTYALSLSETNELVLDVTTVAQSVVITLTADNTTPLPSTTLTAEAALGTEIYFSTDCTQWNRYEAPIVVGDNATYYFKALDGEGNIGTNWISFDNIDFVPPEKPTVSASTAELTNTDVTVTATFSEDSVLKQYSTDNGATWLPYPVEGLVMDRNGTVLFRGVDTAGNASEVTSYEVDNIDKTPPGTPTFVADITEPTREDVTVTATFSEDSVLKQFRLNDGEWTDYTSPVVMEQNGTVSFRAWDAVGNYSETAVCEISNIDKEPPEIVITGNNTKPARSATLTATTEEGLVLYVSTDQETWTEYTGEISISANITYYFMATDAVGNTGTNSITFDNIDTVPPAAPVVSANTTALTNRDVTLTAEYSKDTTQKEYSLDNGETWRKYFSRIVMAANGTVLFRGTDAAGNTSEITSYTIDNIDKTPPDAPTFIADITEPTREDVTVTATFGEDSVLKQYRLDDGQWTDYTGPIALEKNGIVSFRGQDEAGNYSEEAVCRVSNIDKDVPVIRLTGDNTTPRPSATLTAATDAGLILYVSTDQENWTEYTGEIAVTRNETYYFKATDAAGNTGMESIVFGNIDAEAPVIANAVLTQGENDYSFTVSQDVSDNLIPADQLVYSVRYAESADALASAKPVNGLNFLLPESDAGKTLYWQTSAQDAAGNITWTAAQSFTVADHTAPVLNGQPDASFADRRITITWNPAADNIGIAGYRVKVNETVCDVREPGFVLEGVAAGDYTYQVIAYDEEGNETGSTPRTLTVEPRADLYFRSIQIRTKREDGTMSTTTTISVTDDAELLIKVGNMGDIASGQSVAHVWCGKARLDFNVAQVEVGGEQVCVLPIKGSMSTGIQDIRVVLNEEGTFAEYDLSNNEKKLTLNVENKMLGDLVIGSLSLDRTVCSASEDATLTFTVRNIGYEDIAASRAYIYDGETKLGEIDVPAVKMGEESEPVSFTIEAGSLASATHAIRVVANAEKTVSENNRENNGAQTQLTVGFCDLIVSKLSLSRNVCDTEEDVTLNFTVRNIGTDKAADSVAEIYDGDRYLGTITIGEMSAGLSVSKQFTLSAGTLPAGQHDLRVVADAKSNVKESNETNNARTVTLQVKQKDERAPEFAEVSIQQGADDYAFSITAAAEDDVSGENELVYRVRYADTKEELATAEILEGTEFTLMPDQAGKTMYYQVSATDLAGNTTWCLARKFTVADRTAPELGDITVSTADSKLVLSWEAIDNVGVSSYKVYCDGELVSTQETAIFTQDGVSAGSHTYRIEALDDAGNMTTSGNIKVNFDDAIAPAIVSTGARQSADGYDIVFTVNATDNETQSADLATRVQHAFAEQDVENAPLGGMSLTLAPEDAGKTLYYRISVADEAGNTTWSGIRSLVIADTTAPESPADLNGTVNGSDVTLNWAASSDNAGVAGYQVRWGTMESLTGDGVFAETNRHELTSLKEGVYFWQTAAVDEAGNISDWSEVKSFRILPEDAFGTIGTAEQAYDLGTLSGEQTLNGGAISSAADADWFKFTLDSRGTANDCIQITFDNREGDLDLHLYSANGSTLLLSSDGNTGDTECISLKDLLKGTYLLKVSGKDGAMNTFSLSTKKVAGYEADIYDANERNDSMETATIFDVENMPQATVSGLNIDSGDDVDYYQFTLANMGLDGDCVSISFENSVGDLDLALFDAKGVKVAGSAGTGNVETVSFSGLAAGIYYVQVSSSNSVPNEYTLNWNFTSNAVEADELEGREPYAITESVELANLSISAAAEGVTQEDTFKLTLSRPGSAVSKIRFSNYRSDWNGLKYVVKDSSDAVVLSGTGAEILLDGLDAGDYTLTVDTPVAGSFSSYDISVSLPETTATKWTYMVYMAADNDLDKYALYDLVSMQQAELDSQIDIYVFVDRNPATLGDLLMLGSKYRWDSLWSDARVGKISYSPGTTVSVEWESWGELDSSSIETLDRFVTWAQEQSESENYALLMWDHGKEDATLCYDVTSDLSWGSSLSVSEVSGLLAEKSDVSLVIFNNCLLGSEIVATQMTGSTDVIVVSEAESYPLNTTYAYKDFFSAITADMTAKEMAEVLVQNVQQGSGGAPSTLSAIDVSDSRLSAALENLATAVSAANNSKDLSVLVSSLLKAPQDGCAYSGGSVYQSDLYDMILQAMTNSQYSGTSEEFKTALADLKSVLDQLVLCNRTVPANKGYGIAVFNPILTAQSYASPFTSSKKVAEAIRKYLDSAYTSNPAWAGLLYDLTLAYQARPSAYSTQTASFSVSSIPDFGGSDPVSCVDLGCFSGRGVVVDGISLIGELYFSVSVTAKDKASGGFQVTNNADAAVTISVLSDDGRTVAAGTGSVSFENLDVGDYFIRLQSSTDCAVALSFDADWTTGVDRFDYTQSKTNEKFVNGNGSISKASSLAAGYYSGMLTYAGDADWYRIGNVNTDKYQVVVNAADGFAVAEYDADGEFVQAAKYANGAYTMTVKSLNYLFVEGNADINQDQVNAYSVSISGVQSGADVIPPDAPSASADVTTTTNGDVFVSAVFSEDSVGKEYSLDGKTWLAYTEAVKFSENGTVFFRGIDEAGNISEVTSYEVSNIDKSGPGKKDYRFLLGDFNGDGKTMLATVLDGEIEIYANGVLWGGLTLEDDWTLAGIGDFNGDGADDILRVHSSGLVIGEASDANGGFAPQVLNFRGAGWDILGSGDFDNNGADDVLVANPTGASEIVGLLGYWESGVTWTLINGYSAEWEMIATGDFNTDGKCDMLWRNTFIGAGDLTYNAFCTWIVEPPAGESDWRMVSVANPAEWSFLCAGDFNGNGMNDIAMINDVGVVGIWGVEDGWLSSWSILSAVDTSAWTLAGVGDFNADGTDDIAWCSNDTGLVGCWQIENKELAAWQTIATIS